MSDVTAPGSRPPVFTKELKLFLSPEQDEWLAAEAERRLALVRAGKAEAFDGIPSEAHGHNRNVNKGMLIRGLIEQARHQERQKSST